MTEPAVDLSVIVATASSFKDKAVDGLDCYIGEVGLTGEVRRVSRIEQRVQRAKLGFERVIIPQTNIGGWQFPEGIKVHDALKYDSNRKYSEKGETYERIKRNCNHNIYYSRCCTWYFTNT